MKVFHCDNCDQLVFFENTKCMSCEHTLAYLPDVADMGSLAPVDDQRWKLARADGPERLYKLCQNYRVENVCNWAIPAGDEDPLCPSCRLTRVIPDLGRPGHREGWYKLEVAKRRLIVSLLGLHLPLETTAENPERGLAFEFAADPDDETAPRMLTGHASGVITINVAEADDAERERRRVSFGEPYRTPLGHFRHEIGHYYWSRLVDGSASIERFRALFGDERRNYGEALREHHASGAPGDWPDRFVTAYASAHPWEDWAETWAHYLHMSDTLETASACGLALEPRRRGEPALDVVEAPRSRPGDFELMLTQWFPLTYVLSNLNRGLGLPDGYPFVLPAPAIEKLRFVHEIIATAAAS